VISVCGIPTSVFPTVKQVCFMLGCATANLALSNLIRSRSTCSNLLETAKIGRSKTSAKLMMISEELGHEI
jgi:hypothetical protein